MAGISDKAVKTNYAENKYRFQKQELQNKEFVDGTGLEMYEFKYRMDDPQIGRFWSIDPLADRYVYNSTYAFSENKITSYVELEGLEAKLAIAGVGNSNTHYTQSDINAFNSRAKKLESTGDYKASQVQNGKEIINTLKKATSDEGSVSSVVIFAHTGGVGIYLNNNEGFYTGARSYGYSDNNGANVQDLKNSVDQGDIKFSKDASIVLGGCNTCNTQDLKVKIHWQYLYRNPLEL